MKNPNKGGENYTLGSFRLKQLKKVQVNKTEG